MRRITLLVFLCISIISFGQNVIKNGDFQAEGSAVSNTPGPEAWQDGFKRRTIEDPDVAGNYILEVENGDGSARQSFTVEAEKQYSVNFRYRWFDNGGANTSKTMTVTLKNNSGNANIATYALTTNETWTDGSFNFTSGSGVTDVRIQFFKGNGNLPLQIDDLTITIAPTITWDGSEGTDWATDGNWSTGSAPISTDIVSIPDGMPNNPTASSAVSVDKIIIENGASMIANSTVTADVTYNLNVSDTNWHLISSPISSEQYNDDWNLFNSILRSQTSGSENNRALAIYQNATTDGTTGQWDYMQATESATFGSGIGYSLKRNVSGIYSFTGTFPTESVSPAITQGAVSNWNLIGNPYPSYIDIATFITTNTANLGGAFQAIYVWNSGTSSYDDLTTGSIHPGQAFFVSSNVASGNASFTEAMQTHTSGTFYRGTNSPSINLKLSSGVNEKTTQLNFLENQTRGLDPGFDIGMFDGVASDIRIFSNLIEDNTGVAFKRQALPLNEIENTIIPIGVKASAGQEFTISANLENIPSGIEVTLEDSATNTFTVLDNDGKYTLIPTEDLNGTGRFYIHTSSKALSTDTEILNSVQIFNSTKNNLRIVGLQNGKTKVEVYNILGKRVTQERFTSTGAKDMVLPNVTSGVYIVKLQNEAGTISKKIILE